MADDRYGFALVWDPALRFLHWWNAAAIAMMLTTGAVFVIAGHHDMKETTEAALLTAHAIAGFLLGAGILARVLWLFMGTGSARWTDMLPQSSGQRKVFWGTIRYYLKGLRGSPPLYFGHNPFAGVIYLVFFAIACVQVVSGAVFLGLPEDLREKSVIHEVHEAGFVLIIFFIAAHLAAVFVHELKERHGLISAMVHGRKTFTRDERDLLSGEHPEAAKGDDECTER